MLLKFDQEILKTKSAISRFGFSLEFVGKYFEAISRFAAETKEIAEKMEVESHRGGSQSQTSQWSSFFIQYLNEQSCSLQEMIWSLGLEISSLKVQSSQLERTTETLKREIEEDLESTKRLELEHHMKHEKLKNKLIIQASKLNSALYETPDFINLSENRLNETISSEKREFQSKIVEEMKKKLKESTEKIQMTSKKYEERVVKFLDDSILQFHERMNNIMSSISEKNNDSCLGEIMYTNGEGEISIKSFGKENVACFERKGKRESVIPNLSIGSMISQEKSEGKMGVMGGIERKLENDFKGAITKEKIPIWKQSREELKPIDINTQGQIHLLKGKEAIMFVQEMGEIHEKESNDGSNGLSERKNSRQDSASISKQAPSTRAPKIVKTFQENC